MAGDIVGMPALIGTAAAAHAAAAPVIALRGDGVQIYACTQTETGYAWRFKAPEAMLQDKDGKTVGHHFAGPSWQAQDGSLVTGTVLATSSAPAPTAIPWLVLAAKDHGGAGLFANVAYIVRGETVGGVAPVDGCDREHAGTDARIAIVPPTRSSPGRSSGPASLSTPRRACADSCGRSGAWAWISSPRA